MKKKNYIEHLIVSALLLLNLVTVLVYVLKVKEIRAIILINIIGVNILLSLGLYLFYKLGIKPKTNSYDLDHLTKAERHQEKIKVLKTLIEKDSFEEALNLISDYAMEEYKDLVVDDKIPYPLAVLIGRYRHLCRLESIDFELSIENKVVLPEAKTSHAISLIGNLLDNAIDEVRTLKKNKWIMLKIESPMEGTITIVSRNSIRHDVNPEKIFRPGFTTKKTSSSETKRGFGLSIVAEIVSNYEGQLRVDVNEREDISFTIRI